MEIKFKKKLSDYDLLVMFDLATKNTGVCVWDIKSAKPLETHTLVAGGKGSSGSMTVDLWNVLDGFFLDLIKKYDSRAILVYREAAPYAQGKFTTSKTLVALGKAHAVLDLAIHKYDLATFDDYGISPMTTHSHYKHLMGLPASAKVTKENLRDYIKEKYGITPEKGLDETDAAFLCVTFVESFWDKAIDEEIKTEKRHRKTLKAAKAIEAIDARIAELKDMKTDKSK